MVPFSCDSTMTTTMFRRKLEDEIIPSGKKFNIFFNYNSFYLVTVYRLIIIFSSSSSNMAMAMLFLQINPMPAIATAAS